MCVCLSVWLAGCVFVRLCARARECVYMHARVHAGLCVGGGGAFVCVCACACACMHVCGVVVVMGMCVLSTCTCMYV